jgi:hypothetical protein
LLLAGEAPHVLGASLIVLAILERGVLARWPSARRWLGLQAR